ncbi:MAG: hypothetical protein K6A97_03650 [Lachnospiraceae bacterium]|nr:hypothetical protein [Lachnospiraceae bacterium]
MAYNALESMRLSNKEKYGKDLGPKQPAANYEKDACDLKSAALRFLHERCEDLRFDEEMALQEKQNNMFLGDSIKPGQIPYNMEMDIDRLCLERELERFIDSGTTEDAFNIYYCFLEMFLGNYDKSREMIELLSEFEQNGSSLLMKHRDHYSHSVYVFALGLAIYETNKDYRDTFAKFYGFTGSDSEKKAAHCFLEYWGLTSLFHDIGYPFELPFEQVMSYFEVNKAERNKGIVYVAYHDLETLTKLSDEVKAHFKKLYGRDFDNTNELFSFDLTAKMGEAYNFTEEYMTDVLVRKPTKPDEFGYFMDHAWFSATRLLGEIIMTIGIESVTKKHIDALSSIILHNSLYKFAIAFYKSDSKRKAPLDASVHPLAWLLMICDELQCWDRTAYGRNSRTELHPMAADFDFSNGSIDAVYYYDMEEKDKIDEFTQKYNAWVAAGSNGKAPRLKAYSDMVVGSQPFVTDIEKIVNTSICPLTVKASMKKADRRGKHLYISVSGFLHIYDFAVALNARYKWQGKEMEVDAEQLLDEFDELSLEYKLANINQAKSFDDYLGCVGCFYTDRPVDYPMLTNFTPEQVDIIAPLEHGRWVKDHRLYGWSHGDVYENSDERERLRMHKYTMDGDITDKMIEEHYLALPYDEQGKDILPFETMLKLIKKFEGLRIYKIEDDDDEE